MAKKAQGVPALRRASLLPFTGLKCSAYSRGEWKTRHSPGTLITKADDLCHAGDHSALQRDPGRGRPHRIPPDPELDRRADRVPWPGKHGVYWPGCGQFGEAARIEAIAALPGSRPGHAAWLPLHPSGRISGLEPLEDRLLLLGPSLQTETMGIQGLYVAFEAEHRPVTAGIVLVRNAARDRNAPQISQLLE